MKAGRLRTVSDIGLCCAYTPNREWGMDESVARLEQLRRLAALARRMEHQLSLASDRKLMRKQAEKYEAEITRLEAKIYPPKAALGLLLGLIGLSAWVLRQP